MFDKNCELCRAIADGQARKLSKSFYGLICRIHKQLMFVLKDHREKITDAERKEANELLEKFPKLQFRGKGMHTIKNHWHEHLIKRKNEGDL